MAQTTKKNFILDTNVILHDYEAINNFEENDIYIPFIVLEELDKFKKGNDQINFNARAFVRELDLISDDQMFTKGADLGVGKGRLFIVNASINNKKITDAFPEKSPDNRILSVVSEIAEKKPGVKTILVSKDINLRMKARSLGILGPAPLPVVKVNNRFRYRLTISACDDKQIRELLSEVIMFCSKNPSLKGVTLFGDINPI